MIIAIAGRKQSGKTTSCEFIIEKFYAKTKQKAKIYNFADPLKDLCQNILGLNYNQCYGTDDEKNELVNCHWDNKQLSAREVMQFLGTDIFRKIQKNVWVEATIRLIKKENLPLALVADCRFPNEVDAIKQAGGLVIKLNRNPFNSEHLSEQALDIDKYDYSNFDLVINNQAMDIVHKNQEILDFLIRKGVLLL